MRHLVKTVFCDVMTVLPGAMKMHLAVTQMHRGFRWSDGPTMSFPFFGAVCYGCAAVSDRRLKVRIAGFALAAFVIWLLVLAAMTVSFSRKRSDCPSDAAIVLGAAVLDGKPSPVYAARLDHAIDLHKRGIVRRLIFTGGTGEGDTASESEVGAAYAVERGIPRDQILTESVSHTT